MKALLKPIALFLFSLSFFVLPSCNEDSELNKKGGDLSSLPPDTGGEHIAEPLNPASNIYGHYVYLPGGYKDNNQEYPLIIFLHGSGEKGNSQTKASDLTFVLRNGPPRLIEKKIWNPAYPAIVVSPQCHGDWWDVKMIHKHIDYILSKYRINKKRIYLTGLSMGALSSFDYVGAYGDSSYVAAMLPISGGGNIKYAASFVKIPVWAFHGDADTKVSMSGSVNIVNAINKLNPASKALLTIYPKVGHDAWTMTYDGTGMGKESKDYDPFSEDVYNWLFQHKKE